ncbi:MAG: NADH:ubiquinone reductase (Na(+)-transporting) subunit C [Bacteroidales bacterium]|nr:NADH:ubiquinone reductase (Na(+)-transporting) subunit C [Bacteroidales bacterium]
MNTNSNVYTVVYSTILVVVVAAVLAFTAISLQPKQNENVKKETITKVLSAAAQADQTITIAEDADVMALYSEMATAAFYVDGYGKIVGEMNLGKENVNDIKVATNADLKKQNDIFKKIADGQNDLLASLELPVYVINVNGKSVTVIPCYGAGLWGPIWGYIAVAEDGRSIYGAVFDHKSETPGLGAKITEDFFQNQFAGKEFGQGSQKFDVVKGGAHGASNGVDAISGATITSQALGRTINTWATYYEPYLKTLEVAETVEE